MHPTGVAKNALREKKTLREKCEGVDSYVWERYTVIYDSVKWREEEKGKR
jgi:hypothetical protein